MSSIEPKPLRSARSGWKKAVKRCIKLVVAVLVVWAVGRHVARTWHDLHAQGKTIRVAPVWIVASIGFYLAGLTSCGVFFARVLAKSSTPVRLYPAIRAYLISHLGKYVPGKAMVVVVRVGLVSTYGARPATAAFATLYETLAMMAAGGLTAGLGLALPAGAAPLWSAGLGAGLGLALLVVVDPLVFPRLSRLVSVPFPGVGPEALPRFDRKLLGEGLLWSLLGWILLGLSLVAVVQALTSAWVPLRLWPALIGAVALATVAGFAVAVLPGGLGVREGVLMTVLTPALGSDTAVIAALALRLTWVLGEVLAAAVLALVRPARPQPVREPSAVSGSSIPIP